MAPPHRGSSLWEEQNRDVRLGVEDRVAGSVSPSEGGSTPEGGGGDGPIRL